MTLPRKVNGSATDPYKDPTSIGNLAITKGYATRVQVLNALRKQEVRLPLGEILVEDGVLTIGQLEELIMEQEMLRRKMTKRQVLRYMHEKKHEKMHEVSTNLHEVALFLTQLVKI
jgi:hypothetical protein